MMAKNLEDKIVLRFARANAPCTVKKVVRELSAKDYRENDILRAINRLTKAGELDLTFNRTMIRAKPGWLKNREAMKSEAPAVVSTAPLKKKKSFTKWVFFRFFCLLISIACSVVSIKYSYDWLATIMPLWLSVALATALVGSGIVFFEGVILLRHREKLISFIFLLFWAIATTFSISSSVAGQFEKFETNRTTRIDPTLEKLKNIELSIDAMVSEQKTLQDERNAISESLTEDPTNSIIMGRLRTKRNELAKVSQGLQGARAERQALIEASGKTETTRTFFDLIASIFKVDAETVYLIMALWPAVFIDFVSPLGIALFMFLREEKENDAA